MVLVTTLRALKYHGGAGKDGLAEKNLEALVKGFDNLDEHIENMQEFGVPLVVAVCGEIMLMPGLPKEPAAESIDIDASGVIIRHE